MNDGKHLLVAYSWSVNNIGDIGITPGLLRLWGKCHAATPVVVLASQSRENPAVAYMKEYLPRTHKNTRVLPNPFAGRLRSHLDAGAEGSAWRAFHRRWGASKLEAFQKGCGTTADASAIAEDILETLPVAMFAELAKTDPEAAQAFENTGFLLYNSGTTLNFGRLGVRDLWKYTLLWAMPLLIARKQGIPYGINAQSVDAIDWPVDLVHRPLIRDAQFFHCRDSDSLNYLRQRDLLNANSAFRPDSTFFFKEFDEPWADGFCERHSFRDKEFLAVIIRYPADKSEYHDPTGGSVSMERKQDHMRKLKLLIEKWIAETGMPALICPETRDSIPPAKEKLYETLSEEAKRKCLCMEEFWTSEQAYSVFRRARLLASMEMHSVIMSLNVGTPVLHVPFAEAGRKKWMLKDLGLDDWLLDIDEATGDKIADAALAIHRDHAAAAERVARLAPVLEEKALKTIAELDAALRPDGLARLEAVGGKPAERKSGSKLTHAKNTQL